MRRLLTLSTFVALMGIATVLLAQMAQEAKKPPSKASAHRSPVILAPDTLKWAPATDLPAGAQLAALAGDPSKPGTPHTFRLKLPEGYKIPAHWHPKDENVTVLSGTFAAAMGREFDAGKTHDFPPGSYLLLPSLMPHFALARGQTIVQVHGIGPFVFNYVNPAEDPRKKKDVK